MHPRRGALAAAAIGTLEELAGRPEREIAALHGIGPNALAKLREALQARGLAFAGDAVAGDAVADGAAASGDVVAAGVSQELADLLAPFPEEVRQLARALRALVRDTVPDAVEEFDPAAKLIGFTFLPGTYKGLFAAVALHRAHVNLMFSRGAELLAVDASGLLAGTGKRARHIRFTEPGLVADPAVRALVRAAAQRTPRT